MSEAVIDVKNISKKYRIGVAETKHDTLIGLASSWVKYPIRNFKNLRNLSRLEDGYDEDESIFWALRDISFTLNKGDVLGIVGHNGAGKSTLLKILSKITDPSDGRIEIHGRVSSLLEVGTGFHPELTGRENIYMNGTILGMTKKEIDAKYDEIIEFSGITKHIDTPVKRYSSGMKVRLAFSVAAHLEPEILIVDEVLAVGDAQFQKKCLGKMEEAAKTGKTVLFVSHNLAAVKSLCTRAIMLNKGQIYCEGTTKEVLDQYLNYSISERRRIKLELGLNKPITITELAVISDNKDEMATLDTTDQLAVEIKYTINEDVDGTNVGFTISRDGLVIFRSWDTDTDTDAFTLKKKGSYRSIIKIPKELLNAGQYALAVESRKPGIERYIESDDVMSFTLENHAHDRNHASSRGGILIMPLNWATETL